MSEGASCVGTPRAPRPLPITTSGRTSRVTRSAVPLRPAIAARTRSLLTRRGGTTACGQIHPSSMRGSRTWRSTMLTARAMIWEPTEGHSPGQRQRPRPVLAPPEMLPSSLAFHGLPGIINVPTATVVPSGSVDLQYHNKRDPHIFPGVESEKTFNFAIGFLPWVTFGGRGTVADAIDRNLARDISANVELLLLQEGEWWPSVAVGLLDIGGGARFFESKYAVLSKSLWERVRLTAGYGRGPAQLDGPFGGIEVAPIPYVTLLAEYDTRDINAGVRLTPPMPSVLAAYGVPRPPLDLTWQNGKDFAWGVSLRHTFGEAKLQAPRTAQTTKDYHRWTPRRAWRSPGKRSVTSCRRNSSSAGWKMSESASSVGRTSPRWWSSW